MSVAVNELQLADGAFDRLWIDDVGIAGRCFRFQAIEATALAIALQGPHRSGQLGSIEFDLHVMQ